MTDTLYFETFEKLLYAIEIRHELDENLFVGIFEGKIKPIIYSSFAKLSVHFNSEDAEDICQDIFLILWKKSVVGYFLNDKYEKSPIWFLSWCKVVINNYLITKVRKKSNRPTEELDNPEKPIFITDATQEPGKKMINREAVGAVYSAAVKVRSKIPMKLTWLCVYTLIYLGYVENKIEASHKFLDTFYEKSLWEIYSFVITALDNAGWLVLSEADREMLEDELNGDFDGTSYRDCQMSDFLEAEGALAKISDWIYKINKRIIEALPGEVTQWNT